MALQFNYGLQPPRATNGMIADFNAATVDSIVLSDVTGTQAGKAMLLIPSGFPGTGMKKGQRARTPAATRPLLGFVVYNPGKPGDPYQPEYATGETVPVCRQGRQWVYCENFAVDPAVAADTWFTRDSGGTGDAVGNLRYGNDDGATCTAVPAGKVKAIDAIAQAGGAALVLLDFDFRT